MALQLTQDRPVANVLNSKPSVRVEAVDRVDQGDGRHLDEILVGFTPVGEATSQLVASPR